jgi:transposase-like protein
MRLPGSEKLEIIRLVEQSHLPARRTLEMLGIRPSTFYRWYDRYRTGGPEALEDKPSRPDRVWNRIPDEVRDRILIMALDVPDLSPRELATDLLIPRGTSSRNHRSIACSRPMI